jgi:hypothetical protein
VDFRFKNVVVLFRRREEEKKGEKKKDCSFAKSFCVEKDCSF